MERSPTLKIRDNWWATLPLGRHRWRLSADAESIQVAVGPRSVMAADLREIEHIALESGLFLNRLSLTIANQSVTLSGLTRAQAHGALGFLQSSTARALAKRLEELEGAAKEARDHIAGLLSANRYLAESDTRHMCEALEGHYPHIAEAARILDNPLLDLSHVTGSTHDFTPKIHALLDGDRTPIKGHNQRFVQDELTRYRPLFDSIESQPLTHEQRNAAVVMEDNTLLIAAAGSGKSSAIVAKAGYAIRSGFCRPDEILVLAFNSDVRLELQQRLDDRLDDMAHGDATGPNVHTFHSFGMDVLAKVSGAKPSVSDRTTNESNRQRMLSSIIDHLQSKDDQFAERWATFRAVYGRALLDESRFRSIEEYHAHLAQLSGSREIGEQITTLKGHCVRSFEELRIANWLFVMGITYHYERPYPVDTADSRYRQYRPDFWYPDADIYHEHFALDANGRAPVIFGADYRAGVDWKRTLHKEQGTTLIETTSAQFAQGEAIGHLKSRLEAHGIRPRPLAPEVIERHLAEQKIGRIEGLISATMQHLKANRWSFSALRERASRMTDPERARAFLDVLEPIHRAYEADLAANAEVDFTDLITQATEQIRKGRFRNPYRLILVDEFQDISRDRAELLRQLSHQNSDSRLFAVGDDWQAIYRFSGSDIRIMADFGAIFGTTETLRLTRTFRCCQGLADVSSEFVQKNPAQLRKQVQSALAQTNDRVKLLVYSKDDELDELVAETLEQLASQPQHATSRKRVFLLGRYKHNRPAWLSSLQRRFRGQFDISFSTVHRAKGLEASIVFVLDVSSGRYGFPSGIEDAPASGTWAPPSS